MTQIQTNRPNNLTRVLMSVATLCLGSGMSLAAKTTDLRVLADIAPVQSLVAQVMDGIGEPELLLSGAQSPHNTSLRPSDARKLADADVIVWTGPALTPWLSEPMSALAPMAIVVDFSQVTGVVRLPLRDGVGFSGDSHDHSHEADQNNANGADAFDPHLWLDPQNAVALVLGIAQVLAEQDPANKAAYLENAARVQSELVALEAQIANRLQHVRTVPFAVYHDAFHYFEDRFGISAVAAVALADGATPGTARLRQLQKVLADAKIVCTFIEPQFDAKILNAVLSDTGSVNRILDPIGISLAVGTDQYSTMMLAMADSIAACLDPNN